MDSYAVVSMLKKDGRMLKSFKGGRHSFKKECVSSSRSLIPEKMFRSVS